MPPIDLPIKRLVQRRSGDWVRFLQQSCREEWISPFKSEYTPRVQSKLDDVFIIEDPRGTYMVNFEPMGYCDPALPVRMLRYRSDIWEATVRAGQGMPSILQAVFFFYPEHDNKSHQLGDCWGSFKTLEFTYRVIRVWEESRETIIEQGLIGLYPLLPLMKGKSGEGSKQVLQQSITVVNQIEDESLRQDLLAVMGILAGGKYDAELVYTLIRRDMVMQSPIYQDWVKEERAEAETKGRMEGWRAAKKETILKYLSRRFGEQPANLQEKVQKITDIQTLDSILEELFAAITAEEAQEIIFRKTAKSLR